MHDARRRRRRRAPGQRYDVAEYRRAITRACDQAFELPAELAAMHKEYREWVDKWTYAHNAQPRLADVPADIRGKYEAGEAFRSGHRWSPARLRRNATTELRKRFGIEAASVVLGHATPAVTEIYAERDEGKAAKIMGEVG